jgi:uncharacterized phage protein gp47/JayE
MAIVPSTKNFLQLLRGMRAEIADTTSINTFDRDSKTRALMDVFTQEQIDLRTQAQEVFYANQVSSAKGQDLDRIGESHGVPRQEVTFAGTVAGSQNVAFYVDTGTFGTINSGLDILIPAGTSVFSAPNNNELGETIKFTTTENVTLLSTSSLAYVAVTAVNSGPDYNVGSGTLRNHNFLSYSDSINNTLKIINFFPILNGRSRERDSQYRFRISQQMVRIKQVNDTAIRLNSIDVPGVINTKIISGYYGVGTVGVIVLGADNESNSELVNAVQSRLDRLRGPGLRIIASPSVETLIDLELEIKSVRDVVAQERRTSEEQIKKIILTYLRSAGIGGTVSLQDGGRTKLFKNVYLRKGFSNGSMSERERLIVDTFALDEDSYADLGNITFSWM